MPGQFVPAPELAAPWRLESVANRPGGSGRQPPFLLPLAALRSSEAVRSSRVIDTAASIDAAPLKRETIESEFS
jgi:hypothetical protein